MANYDLAFTGPQIDSAIGKVQNAETTVEDSPNMIQSAAVFTAINGLTTGNFSPGTLVTSGVTFPDNNTTIPTCAAVKAFATSSANALYTATYTATQPNSEYGRDDYSSSSGPTMGFTASTGGMTINTGGEAIVPSSGSYVMTWQQYARDDNAGYRVNNGDTRIRYKRNGSVFAESNASGSVYPNSTTWLYTRGKSNLISLSAGDRLVADVRRYNSSDQVNWGYASLTLQLVTPFFIALADAGF